MGGQREAATKGKADMAGKNERRQPKRRTDKMDHAQAVDDLFRELESDWAEDR